jgi:hypothetical protein
VSYFREAEDEAIESMATTPTPHAILLEAYRAWDLEVPNPLPGCKCPLCRPRSEGRLGDDAVQRARGSGILQVARDLGLGDARKQGREHVVRCPFHNDRTPSLRLNPEKGVWYCSPCALGGDSITLVMMHRGCSFKEAVEWLAAA